jgi:hypothetical protein
VAPEAFSAATEDLSLLPFNLERTGTNQYLVSNMVGDFIRLTEDELNRLVDLRIRPGDGLYEKAYAAHLVTGTNQKAQRQLLAARLRSRMSFLQQVTPLHIFVVTLRCEHSCPYCQVSRQSTDRSRFDMSEETAMRALDIAFASPAARIKIEFQGGEPLLNFPLIRTIVANAKARSGKKVDWSSRPIWRCWMTLFLSSARRTTSCSRPPSTVPPIYITRTVPDPAETVMNWQLPESGGAGRSWAPTESGP